MEEDAPPGVPEWVVTYGDMMSLLLTFFIMLVSLSEIDADKKYRAVLDAIQQSIGYRTGPIAPPGKNFPLNGMVEQLEHLGSFTDIENGHGGVKNLAVEGKDLKVYRTREGKSRRVGSPILFEVDNIALSPLAEKQLRDVADEMAGKQHKIEIRAHTSKEEPAENANYPDKSQLTYLRARNVKDFLADIGVDPMRVRISAVGDSEPLTDIGDRRAHKHERVEVLILDAFTQSFIGPDEKAN